MMIAREQLRLKKLSDKKLFQSLDALVKKDNTTTLGILLHLVELDRRRSYLELGYRSLFDYVTRQLKYSSSSASRRINTARCVARFPEVYDLLVSGAVNLSTVLQVSSILNEKNKDDLLGGIQGKSQSEVERLISGFQPPAAYRDKVKPVRVAVAATRSAVATTDSGRDENWTSLSNSTRSGCKPINGHMAQPELSQQDASGGGVATGVESDDRDAAVQSRGTQSTDEGETTRYEQMLLIQFLASHGFKKKYDEVRALLSNRLPDQTFETVFEAVLDEFIDRHSPEKRHERREKRSAKKLEKQNDKQVAKEKDSLANKRRETSASTTPTDAKKTRKLPAQKRTRHIPAKIRDAVFKRDGGKCAFVGTNGKRCNSTWGLQIDHIEPFAKGGKNTAENLRLLCGRHNRFAAEKIYGKGFMEEHYQREYTSYELPPAYGRTDTRQSVLGRSITVTKNERHAKFAKPKTGQLTGDWRLKGCDRRQPRVRLAKEQLLDTF